MFLNPNIRNKLILKQKYNNKMKNKFTPDFSDNTIYLQQNDKKEIEYKNIVIVGERATKDLEDNDNIEIFLPKKISSEVEALEDEVYEVDEEDEEDKDDEEDEEDKDEEEDEEAISVSMITHYKKEYYTIDGENPQYIYSIEDGDLGDKVGEVKGKKKIFYEKH